MTTGEPQLSKAYFVSRRQGVRQERSRETLQQVWRYGLLLSMFGFSVWLGQQPLWELQESSQIIVTGTRVLSPQKIQERLALPLPLKIFEVEPSHLVQPLHQESLIQDVQVRRQLWPPSIELTIRERQPVATLENGDGLDAEGLRLSRKQYPLLPRPPLLVVGYQPTQALQWQALYPLLRGSAVPITKVNLYNPRNLMVLTPLGVVHLGQPDAQLLQEQLLALEQLQNLPRLVPLSSLQFIDLTAPRAPRLRRQALPTTPIK